MEIRASNPAMLRNRPSLVAAVLSLLQVWHERRKLAQLDHHALNDLGLTEADVARELRKSIWDAPTTWTR